MSEQTPRQDGAVIRIDSITITERDLTVAVITATGVLVILALLRALTR